MMTLEQQQFLQLLNPAIEPIVHFSGQPVSEGSTAFEVSLLREIQENNSGLVMYRTEGLFKNREYHTLEKHAVYKLYSAAHGTELTFTLDRYRGENAAVVLILNTAITKQGNFFSLKNFVLNRVCKVLFAAGLAAIVGEAQPNGKPVRQKRDFRRERTKAGVPKLVALYEHLGFTRTKGSNVVMTFEAYCRALEGSRRRFERGGGVLAGQTVS